MPLPLDLYAEVTAADGTRYKWDANQAPGDRLQGVTFGTKIGEGFSAGGGRLPRRIDQDYLDLNLINTVTFTGADGSVAYEGRIAEIPRELSDRHSIGVTLTGWMAHAKDRKFTETYVGRLLGDWSGMSRARKAAVVTLFSVFDAEQVIDPSDSEAAVATAITGAWATPAKPVAEAWYDAGPGNLIREIQAYWRVESTNLDTTNANWFWRATISTDDKDTARQADSGNLRAAGPGTVTVTVPSGTTAGRFAMLQLLFNATPAGADGIRYAVNWYKLAVYGDHGAGKYTGQTGEPQGVHGGEVIRDIAARWCPELDTSGVQDTDYVIQQLAFRTRTTPYDAFLEINKYHLWHLGVWEDKRLVFEPYDLSDYDWEIRTDDPGTTFAPQGPTTENLFNGISVTYTDLLTGVVNTLDPDDYTELADASTTNPWNQHGIARWDEITLARPTLLDQALEIGRAALADRNQPRTPGTITVRGYVRDRAGVDQPAWKVRAGDTISITNFPNDTPRLIVETSYDDDSKTVSLSIDRPFATVEAYLDRLDNALTARGVT